MKRWMRLCIAGTAAAAFLIVAPAVGHDSLAPHGAAHTWLPGEDWVVHHWVPFDERVLAGRLGLADRELEAYLYDDHRSLAELARRRGLDVIALRDELSEAWRRLVDDRQLAVLRDHTERLLTQPHLAQHMLFHVFHGNLIGRDAHELIGVSAAEFWRLRVQGLTPLEIARITGLPESTLRTHIAGYYRWARDGGIRLRLAWPAEADRLHARQMARLPCWLTKPSPPRDPSNPYGKARLWHGPHERGWPRTRRDRRANERRVERVRRQLPHSCWNAPPAWSWSAHGLSPP